MNLTSEFSINNLLTLVPIVIGCRTHVNESAGTVSSLRIQNRMDPRQNRLGPRHNRMDPRQKRINPRGERMVQMGQLNWQRMIQAAQQPDLYLEPKWLRFEPKWLRFEPKWLRLNQNGYG